MQMSDINITNKSLSKERDFFIKGFIAIVLYGFVLFYVDKSYPMSDTTFNIVMIAAQMFNIYLVFRLSRFLKHPVWLTAIFCLLIPIPILNWTANIGILVSVRIKRKQLNL